MVVATVSESAPTMRACLRALGRCSARRPAKWEGGSLKLVDVRGTRGWALLRDRGLPDSLKLAAVRGRGEGVHGEGIHSC